MENSKNSYNKFKKDLLKFCKKIYYVYGEIRKNFALFWVSKTPIFIIRGTLLKNNCI